MHNAHFSKAASSPHALDASSSCFPSDVCGPRTVVKPVAPAAAADCAANTADTSSTGSTGKIRRESDAKYPPLLKNARVVGSVAGFTPCKSDEAANVFTWKKSRVANTHCSELSVPINFALHFRGSSFTFSMQKSSEGRVIPAAYFWRLQRFHSVNRPGCDFRDACAGMTCLTSALFSVFQYGSVKLEALTNDKVHVACVAVSSRTCPTLRRGRCTYLEKGCFTSSRQCGQITNGSSGQLCTTKALLG